MVFSNETEFYFRRFGFSAPQIQVAPPSNLGLVVVVPCYNESCLIEALSSLWACERPHCSVEVLVVLNSSEISPSAVLEQNLRTLELARRWIGEHPDPTFSVFILHFPQLPRKKAGVGLARKIGMDEALARLDLVKNLNGVIACFDADCVCDKNYLVALQEYFQTYARSPGCSIYFEHPLEAENAEAITAYELHLRYYVQALRYASYPLAFHTVGSSMAVRAGVYRKQGGMNTRQAGEDFYFLHKVFPLGNFGDLTTSRIIASPRASDRVPFGTGRAVRDFIEKGKRPTYPFEAFIELARFCEVADQLLSPEFVWKDCFGPAMSTFLERENFFEILGTIRASTTNRAAFRNRLFWWLDGFRVMKFIHLARDEFYGAPDVGVEAARLLHGLGERDIPERLDEMLFRFRQIERTRPRLPQNSG